MALVTMWCLNAPPKNLLSYVQYPVKDASYKILGDGTVFRNERRSYFTVKQKNNNWIAVPDNDTSVEIPIQVLQMRVSFWGFVF